MTEEEKAALRDPTKTSAQYANQQDRGDVDVYGPGILRVQIIQARGLVAGDKWTGTSDAYVKVSGTSWQTAVPVESRTHVVERTRNPVWRQTMAIPVFAQPWALQGLGRFVSSGRGVCRVSGEGVLTAAAAGTFFYTHFVSTSSRRLAHLSLFP